MFRILLGWTVPLLIVAVLLVGCGDDQAGVGDLGPGGDLAAADMRGPDQVVPDRALPDQATPDLPAPDLPRPDLEQQDQILFDQALPDRSSSDQTVPDQLILDQAIPDQLVPDQAIPDQLVLDQAIPDQLVPDQLVPDQLPPDAPLPTCMDKMKNGDETDVDCGGSTCAPCGLNKGCAKHVDCAPHICGPAKTCVLAVTCLQLKTAHAAAKSGQYMIKPASGTTVFKAYCEMIMGGGGWTLIESLTRDHKIATYGNAQWYKDIPLMENVPSMTGDYRMSKARMEAVRLLSTELAATTDKNGLSLDYWRSKQARDKFYLLGDDTGSVNYKLIKYEALNFKGKTYTDKVFQTWMRPTPKGWPQGGHNCVDDPLLGCSSCDYWGWNSTKDPGFTGHKSPTAMTHFWFR